MLANEWRACRATPRLCCAAQHHQGKKSFCWLLSRAALGLLIMFVFDPEFELEMCGGGSLYNRTNTPAADEIGVERVEYMRHTDD